LPFVEQDEVRRQASGMPAVFTNCDGCWMCLFGYTARIISTAAFRRMRAHQAKHRLLTQDVFHRVPLLWQPLALGCFSYSWR